MGKTTNIKHIEEELAKSEERYRTVLEGMGDSYYEVDLAGNFTFFNDALCRQMGYSREELMGMNYRVYTPPEDVEKVFKLYNEVYRTGEPLYVEMQEIRKDGTRLFVENSVIPLRNKRGEIVGFSGIGHDVTERKHAEGVLAEEATRRRMLMERSRDGISILDEDSKLLEANQRFAEILGYTAEELKGLHTWDWDTQWTREELLEMGHKVDEAGAHLETLHRRKDGTLLDVELSVNSAVVAGKKLIFCVSRDITERRKAEEALKQSETKYRTLVDNISDAIIVAQDNTVKFFNDKALEISGYSREELVSVPFWNFIHPEDMKKAAERYLEGLSDEATAQFYDLRFIHKTGDVRWVDIALGTITWEGRPATIALVSDVTERRRAEEALRRSEQNFRDSIENSPLGVRILDKDGKTLYANRALLDTWGYGSVEELEAVPKEQRYTPETYAEHLERLDKRKRGEPAPLSYEAGIVRSDGQVRILSVSRGELLWGGKECFQIVSQDVTERKQAEQALADEAMRRRILMDQSRDGICILDYDSKVVETNPRFAEMLGYSLEEVRELHTWDWDPQFTREELLEMGHNVDAAGIRIETHHRRKDGTVFDVDVGVNSVVVGGKKLLYCVSRDITERKKAEEALAKSEERYRNILAEIQEGYYETDLAGNFTFVNDATCRLLGHSREEIIGTSYKAYVPKDEVKGVYKAWNKVYRTGRPVQSYPFTVIRKDKKQTFLESSVSPLRNKEGKTIGFRSISRDVTERAQFERKLAEMATHDALTGLPNRTLLSDRYTVALALSRRSRSRLAVLMLDLDRFKVVNDSMGHDVGDKLLKAVGKRLKATVRKSDTVARIGGDEFVLLLPQIPHEEEAVKFSQRILDAFREPFVFDDQRINITTSIGIAIYPEGGKDIESLLKSADTAMYWAKEQGRDIYRLFDGSEAATLLAKRRATAEA